MIYNPLEHIPIHPGVSLAKTRADIEAMVLG
jgi:hypothetical protein